MTRIAPGTLCVAALLICCVLGLARADQTALAISSDGRWGYIDGSGKVVVDTMRIDVRRFSEGLAAVRVADEASARGYIPGNELPGKWGFIDETGKYIIQPQYDHAEGFSDGLALVRVGRGRMQEYRYLYIDKAGKVIIDKPFDMASSFSEGLAAVAVGEPGSWKYGYIDKTGRLVIQPTFDSAQGFSEGLAAVGMWLPDPKLAGKVLYGIASVMGRTGCVFRSGYIDNKGKTVTRTKFERAGRFSEGLAAVAMTVGDELRYGFIDRTGRYAIALQFPDAGDFHQGRAMVLTVGRKRCLIDKTGQVTHEFRK